MSINRKIDVKYGSMGIPVGELIFEIGAGRKQSSRFSYVDSWIARSDAFALAPSMPLDGGPFFYTGDKTALPAPMADAAPDSWGRKVLKAHLRCREQNEHLFVTELDYLVEPVDQLRLGALRFFDTETALPLSRGTLTAVPHVKDAGRFIKAAYAFQRDSEVFKGNSDLSCLAHLLGSLGGARPKMNVVGDDGSLWIAKLPRPDDDYDVAKVEANTLRLAALVGITASEARTVRIDAPHSVLLVKRFDRVGDERVPFISAQTFMGLSGAEAGNYVDLAMQIEQYGAQPRQDIEELYRRLMFSVLVSNFDDHLRNHGFLLGAGGKWRLSPAFDINPSPGEGQTLKTAISDIHGNESSIEAVIDAAPYFGIDVNVAVTMAKEMQNIMRA
ncbi:type II toxin-antitoxin system HipA family toxin [Mesorhizobium sp. SP-1A]|uniref:type II toxin-antitoxin system HipA family toxin n=1 Tax=Mesorhizobium sp. SP-1A TaxID=3077840 RepID=UPI0028F6EE83|nr:type II toxin-antitoxin system HipA family toxin [Mesorhizobium sp. SP-1A]